MIKNFIPVILKWYQQFVHEVMDSSTADKGSSDSVVSYQMLEVVNPGNEVTTVKI